MCHTAFLVADTQLCVLIPLNNNLNYFVCNVLSIYVATPSINGSVADRLAGHEMKIWVNFKTLTD